MKPGYWLVWPFILATILYLAAGEARARMPGIVVAADLGFGGYTVPGCWMPLRIALSQGVDGGRVEILRRDVKGRIRSRESFSAAQTAFECPIRMSEELERLTIRLRAGQSLIHEVNLNPNGKKFPGHLFLACDVPAALQQKMEEMLQPDEPLLTVPVSLREFPITLFGYDGVSGLVLADPGPVLKPAQAEALNAWLCGGGRIVLWGLRPFADSMLRLLKLTAKPGQTIERRSIGFGRVILIPDGDRDHLLKASAAQWRSLLKLKPYRDSARLTLNRVFPETPDAAPNPPALQVVLVSIVLVWGGLITFFIYRRRMNWPVLLGLLFLLTLAAIPWSRQIAAQWRRGYDIRCRMLFWPAGAGVMAKIDLNGKENNAWELNTAPWGGVFRFGGAEFGRIRPDRPAQWEHGRPNPQALMETLSSSRLHITGWLPARPVFSNPRRWIQNSADLYLYQTSGVFSPIRLKEDARGLPGRGGPITRADLALKKAHAVPGPGAPPPLWQAAASEWLRHLAAVSPPGTEWLIGRRTAFRGGFQFQETTFWDVVWAMPVPDQT